MWRASSIPGANIEQLFGLVLFNHDTCTAQLTFSQCFSPHIFLCMKVLNNNMTRPRSILKDHNVGSVAQTFKVLGIASRHYDQIQYKSEDFGIMTYR